jgi:O-antigen/teichoic acid export membrane protein
MNVSDRYVIQFFRGAGEVGIYAANYSLAAGVGGLITAPVLLATHPLLMRAWDAGRRDVAERWLGLIVEWYVVAGVLVVGVLVLFSADIAWLLLGAEFRAGHRVLPIAMAGAVAWQFGLYAQKPLEFEGRVRSVLGISVATAVLNVGTNLLLVPRFGYMAAAFSTVLAYVAYAALTATLGRRVLPWKLRWNELGGTLALAAGGLVLAPLARAWAEPALGYAAGLAAAMTVTAVMLGLVARRLIGPLLGRA